MPVSDSSHFTEAQEGVRPILDAIHRGDSPEALVPHVVRTVLSAFRGAEDHEREAMDASNGVRLCDKCEGEYGAGIADKGDRACSVCGQHDAPHIYPALSREAEVAKNVAEELRKLTNGTSSVRPAEGWRKPLRALADRLER